MLHNRRITKTRTRGLARAAAGAGVFTGAIVATFLVPGTAHAAPTTEDKLDTLTTDYKKAVEKRDDIAERIKALDETIKGSDDVVTGAVALIGTPATTVDGSGTLLSQLTDLSDLAREQTRAVDEAAAAIAAANATKAELKTDLAAAKKTVSTLSKQKDELENKLAQEEAETESSTYSGDIPDVSGKAGKAVSFAYGAIGIPYVFGATGPDGYDCSGLTMAAWAAAGVSLPHYTVDQWNATTPISKGDLRPGDLVFYAGLGHVAIYVGDGQVIHAPQPGESVKISDVDMMAADGYRRV
ncbi:C40 family peptidase [Phytomonospora endophytica]|uniref:Cell wall-associated NlpC family hydrolase n=1 Tax=Phytomonospora endophytica TaxID=714109 RepID=A0A841G7G9_9ACTN|nr:C40 family peptidase [Phytomonospora endophytica]MBB6040020.1 cell wall-associated NlpC family hydrolase [Phytomonospora endophytica]